MPRPLRMEYAEAIYRIFRDRPDFAVYLNPVRAGLVERGAKLESYRWTSYGKNFQASQQRPCRVRVSRLLGEMGILQDSPAGRQEFAERMERRRHKEAREGYELARRSCRAESDYFRKELIAAAAGRVGALCLTAAGKRPADSRAVDGPGIARIGLG